MANLPMTLRHCDISVGSNTFVQWTPNVLLVKTDHVFRWFGDLTAISQSIFWQNPPTCTSSSPQICLKIGYISQAGNFL